MQARTHRTEVYFETLEVETLRATAYLGIMSLPTWVLCQRTRYIFGISLSSGVPGPRLDLTLTLIHNTRLSLRHISRRDTNGISHRSRSAMRQLHC